MKSCVIGMLLFLFGAIVSANDSVVGSASDNPLETIELTELPQSAVQASPWISPDGLSLYWSARANPNSGWEIWNVTRASVDESFGNPKRLFAGEHFSLAGDQLEIVLMDKEVLYSARRKSTDVNFSRPQKIAELSGYGNLMAPRLFQDGLTMFVDKGQTKIPYEPLVTTRPNRTSAWSKPTTVSFPSEVKDQVRALALLGGGKHVLGVFARNSPRAGSAVLFETSDGGRTVTNADVIKLPDTATKIAFPYYCEATKELYFLRLNAPNTLPLTTMMVVRGMSVPSLSPPTLSR